MGKQGQKGWRYQAVFASSGRAGGTCGHWHASKDDARCCNPRAAVLKIKRVSATRVTP